MDFIVMDFTTRDKIIRRFEREKKKLIPNQNLVDTHPMKDKILKEDFTRKLKHGQEAIASNTINGAMTAIRTITSKTYSDAASLYGLYRGHSLFKTEADQNAHLDWIFEQFEKGMKDAKALLKTHRKELVAELEKENG